MEPAPVVNSLSGTARILNRVSDIAVLPHVVFKVLELSGSTDNSTAVLERAITVDPGFSSKVLTLANSAAMGLSRKVTSIREAIMFLGFRNVRQLAMTIGVFDLFGGKSDRDSMRRRNWWRHSVDTAVCCRYISDKFGRVSAEEAYTCGLLHQIGKTLLDRSGVADYSEVEERNKFGVSIIEAEEELFGCNHVELAIAATKKWNLPEALGSGLDYTSEPLEGDESAALRACTALGSAIAVLAMKGFNEHDCSLADLVPMWAAGLLGISEADLPATIEGGIAAIQHANLQV